MLESASKILIIRFSSLGDVLLTTPLIRTLKNRSPNASLDFLVKSQFHDAIKFNPHLNTVHLFNKNKDSFQSLSGRLKNKNYDLIIDLQNNLRSKRLCLEIGAPVFKFKKPSIRKLLLVKTKINFLKDLRSIPERYADSLSSQNFELDEKGLEIFPGGNFVPQIEKSDKNIAFCPGSVHFTKMYPKEYFIEAGNILTAAGFKIILLGGASDGNICSEIQSNVPGSVNLAGKDNLLQISENMNQCKLAVCNDSGMMHTAAASGIPVFAIFGSTVKEFGFSPYKIENLIFEDNSVSCRPCSHTGKRNCPKGHFKCMKNLTPEKMTAEILKFIGEL